MKPEPVYFVTEDKWTRLPGGKLDRMDKRAIREAGKGARVINFEQMAEEMQKTEPEKYEGFKRELGKQKGIVITSHEQLLDIGKQANETMRQFESFAATMHVALAYEIRKWRVDEHLTWRSIARRATGDSNQLLGMAICQRAANMCNEHWKMAPWN
jgi:hypothetical protein